MFHLCGCTVHRAHKLEFGNSLACFGQWPHSPITHILLVTLIFFFKEIFIFWPCHMTCRILVPWPGIELMSPALKGQSLSHWTTRMSHLGLLKYQLFAISGTSHFLFSLPVMFFPKKPQTLIFCVSAAYKRFSFATLLKMESIPLSSLSLHPAWFSHNTNKIAIISQTSLFVYHVVIFLSAGLLTSCRKKDLLMALTIVDSVFEESWLINVHWRTSGYMSIHAWGNSLNVHFTMCKFK